MPLPYSRATSGPKALAEMQKLLANFGCTQFGSMTDTERGDLLVQFRYRGRSVSARANYKGYAAALLKGKRVNPVSQRNALAQAEISVCSVLRDWIRGQITAIETGILSFEGAFLGQILLGSGKTILEHVEDQNMLPKLEAPKP